MDASYVIREIPGPELPKEYDALILSRWLRSLRFGNPYFKRIDSQKYYDHYHNEITNILASHNTMVRLACLSDDNDIVLGFSVHRHNLMDYVHVQKDFRRIGIGYALIPDGIDTFTHLTHLGMEMWQSKKPKLKGWKFNPFAQVIKGKKNV